NKPQSGLFARQGPRNIAKTANWGCFCDSQTLLQCVFPLERWGAPAECARILGGFTRNPCSFVHYAL
ncbi:MAG: hypothetical protein PUC06_02000, partial [Oscillospiraceae bacterium]|nr:hypothetical protein [Oscillospiraceae bacterium]